MELALTGTYRCGTALDFDQLPRSTLVKGTRSVGLFSCNQRTLPAHHAPSPRRCQPHTFKEEGWPDGEGNDS